MPPVPVVAADVSMLPEEFIRRIFYDVNVR